jgi:ABC-type phosphate transport system substrate-binding protein
MEFYQSDFRMLFNASGEETFTQLPEMAGTPVSVIRGDHAPIAVAFAQYLSIAYLGSDQSTCANPNTTKVTSDQQMVATVGSTPYAVGYADYNDAVAAASGTNPTIDIMDIPGEWGEVYYWKYPFDTPAHVTANWNVLRNVAQAQYTYLQQGGDNLGMMTPTQPWWDEIEATNDGYTYPAALFRAHYFVTEGQPDSITQNFISYVLADKEGIFQKNNMWSMKDIYS